MPPRVGPLPALPRDGAAVLVSASAAVDDYVLLEVTDELLAALASTQPLAPHCLELRGSADSDAVLVSDRQTYGVRLVETSNTALLLDDGRGDAGSCSHAGSTVTAGATAHEAPGVVRGQVTRHYEMFELRPAVCHLRAVLLRSGLYSGPLSAGDLDSIVSADNSPAGIGSRLADLHSFDSLRRVVQASDAQLCAQLHSVSAYEVDGCYRLLHDEYAQLLVRDVLNAAAETKQRPHAVHAVTVARTLSHLHAPHLVRQCLHNLAAYSQQRHRPAHHEDEDEDEHVSLCPQRLARQLAHSVFNSAPPASHMQPADAVLRAITAAMPAPLACQPAHLLSVAVLLPSPPPSPASYRYLPAHSLPADAPSRLQRLFAVKERWTAEEMAAWMDADDIATGAADSRGGKADTALLKHCRTIAERDSLGNKTVYYLSTAAHT